MQLAEDAGAGQGPVAGAHEGNVGRDVAGEYRSPEGLTPSLSLGVSFWGVQLHTWKYIELLIYFYRKLCFKSNKVTFCENICKFIVLY